MRVGSDIFLYSQRLWYFYWAKQRRHNLNKICSKSIPRNLSAPVSSTYAGEPVPSIIIPQKKQQDLGAVYTLMKGSSNVLSVPLTVGFKHVYFTLASSIYSLYFRDESNSEDLGFYCTQNTLVWMVSDLQLKLEQF